MDGIGIGAHGREGGDGLLVGPGAGFRNALHEHAPLFPGRKIGLLARFPWIFVAASEASPYNWAGVSLDSHITNRSGLRLQLATCKLQCMFH